MFCSTTFLMKRCYLLYVFIAIAILLLLFCMYLYKKYTKQNKLEDIVVDKMNFQEDTSIVENFEGKSDTLETNMEQIATDNGDGDPALIRTSLENEEENIKLKENDKEYENQESINDAIETTNEITDE